MNRVTRAVVLGIVAAATILGSIEFASARDRYWQRYHGGYRHGHNGDVAAGIIGGLAAGAIIGGALSEPDVVYEERPIYVRPRPQRVYVEPERVYVEPEDYGDDVIVDRPVRREVRSNVSQGTLEPWTAEWRSYCRQRFQSFNATTGTYTGYDGRSHFCTAG